MTTATLTRGSRSTPYVSALDRDLASRLAAGEYDRMVATLEQLTPEQWSAPTVNTGWDVRDVAGHVLGMTEMAATLRETVRQQLTAARRVKREGGLSIDALTALQVEEHAALSRGQVVDGLRAAAPRAVRSRRRTPGFLRNRVIEPQQIGGREEYWTMGYLLDTILTRDPFMHRLDIEAATGVLVPAEAGHEGVLVDDIVSEWAARHGAPYSLELTGPAGGHWESGSGGERLSLSAADFCRAVSGRGPAPGLLATAVPF